MRRGLAIVALLAALQGLTGLGILNAQTVPESVKPSAQPAPNLGEIRVFVEPSFFGPTPIMLDRSGRPRPVTQSFDARGVRSSFVSNEILVTPRDEAELRAVIGELSAEIIGTDAVPSPQPELRSRLRDIPTAARTYTLRVDTARLARDDLPELIRAAGGSGDVQFSDEAGARLTAAVLRLRARGIKASLDLILEPQFGRDKALENGGTDFFNEGAYLSGPGLSSITRAWQLLFAARFLPTRTMAVIDRGFWINNGLPGDPGGIADLAPAAQFDFVDNDNDNDVGGADGTFHGYATASVAAAAANISQGVAGAAGFTAIPPMLFRVETAGETVRAIRTAVRFGADVVNISVGATCNMICQFLTLAKVDLIEVVGEATRNGVVIVAAAGNDSEDVDDLTVLPCVVVTICVGATAGNSSQPASFTNAGGSVGLFAPQPVTALRGGFTTTTLGSFTGTSAAAPVVAGTVAMMQSANPAATPEQITAMLLNSAWTQNPANGGGKVGRWLHAYEAVLAALGGRIADDVFEAGDDPGQPRTLLLTSNSSGGLSGAVRSATLRNRQDIDAYRITLPDYRRLTVSLHFMRGLNATTVEIKPPAGIDPEPFTETFAPDLRRQVSELVPPGTYDLIVEGGGPQLYDLEVEATPAAMPRDRFDQVVSPFVIHGVLINGNDTPADASEILSREHLTLHDPDDIDWLRLKGPPLLNARVVVTSDLPLDIALYKEGDLVTPIKADTGTAAFMAGLNVAVTYLLRVKSSKATRYTVTITGDPLVADEQQLLPWIDLGDPPALLDRAKQVWRLRPRSIARIASVGRGVKLAIQSQGSDEPARTSAPDNAGREVLDLSGFPSDRTALLTIERADGSSVDSVLPLQLQAIRR